MQTNTHFAASKLWGDVPVEVGRSVPVQWTIHSCSFKLLYVVSQLGSHARQQENINEENETAKSWGTTRQAVGKHHGRQLPAAIQGISSGVECA